MPSRRQAIKYRVREILIERGHPEHYAGHMDIEHEKRLDEVVDNYLADEFIEEQAKIFADKEAKRHEIREVTEPRKPYKEREKQPSKYKTRKELEKNFYQYPDESDYTYKEWVLMRAARDKVSDIRSVQQAEYLIDNLMTFEERCAIVNYHIDKYERSNEELEPQSCSINSFAPGTSHGRPTQADMDEIWLYNNMAMSHMAYEDLVSNWAEINEAMSPSNFRCETAAQFFAAREAV